MATKRVICSMLAMLALMVFLVSPTQAYHINPYSFWYGGHGINVVVDQIAHNNIGVGSLHARIGTHELVEPIYCLDLYHSFNWGQHWDVDMYIIPPDPFPGYPPHNTDQAAWIYQTYGKKAVANNADKAEGVQLALWEVSHDLGWATNYSSTTWNTSGDFIYTGGGNRYTQATSILDQLYYNLQNGITLGQSAAYYQPVGSTYGQGFIGDPGEVPEPASLVLLGLSLVAAAGVGISRRRRTR